MKHGFWWWLALALLPALALSQAAGPDQPALVGDVERGRLVFGPCRTCHYPDPAMGHNNGPNLHRIFGKVAGKQPGFDYYSETFRNARFVWTPRLLDLWLANPRAMFPESTMMSLGVPDAQARADLIAYLKEATVRDAGPEGEEESGESTADDRTEDEHGNE